MGIEGLVQFTPSDTCTLTSYADDVKLFAHTPAALTRLCNITQSYLASFSMAVALAKCDVLQVGGKQLRSIEVCDRRSGGSAPVSSTVYNKSVSKPAN